MADLREQGMTVIFVEHDMDVVRDISDWVVVMAQGSIIAESTPEELSNNGAVVDAYLDRIAAYDQAGPALRAIRAVNPNALAQAQAYDADRAVGRQLCHLVEGRVDEIMGDPPRACF